MHRQRHQSGMGLGRGACGWKDLTTEVRLRSGLGERAPTRSWGPPLGGALGRLGAGPALTPRPRAAAPRRVLEPEAAGAEEAERRVRGCRLQYQRASVRFLVPFAAHPLDGGRRLTHLLGPDWLLDVSHLVAPHARVQDPSVAALEGGRVLVGREPGVTSIEVSRRPEKGVGDSHNVNGQV